ncbi:MAG: sugar phosphate isomerase/epimerase [Gemmataceae bacterium]|nr:sugar phosphate isomerase/epimerase [Gemmataceae bacterium]
MSLTRRQVLGGMAATAVTASTATAQNPAPARPADPFVYCLNTSTIRGQNLPIADEVDLAAKAGYQAIEPWIGELQTYVKNGGDLRDLAKRISDAGLRVPSAIGFAEWIVDDEAKRKQGLENARRDMDMVRTIGGARIAAPPSGATNQNDLSLTRAADRYRELLEIGGRIGVTPMVEVWGFSRSLSRLGECAMVAIEAKHPQACILADVYHLHKGGSGFEGIKLLSAASMHVFHMNDYPNQPGRTEITDAHRVYPGDGVAPLPNLLRELRQTGFRGVLSLELFNRDYWKQDPLAVARTGLDKMRAVVRESLQK